MRSQISKQVHAEQATPEPIFNEPAQPEGEPEMSAEEKEELERLKAENEQLKAEKPKPKQRKWKQSWKLKKLVMQSFVKV